MIISSKRNVYPETLIQKKEPMEKNQPQHFHKFFDHNFLVFINVLEIQSIL